MPLKILHLLGTANTEGTGIARIVAALAAGLDPKKYQMHAWFLGPPGPLVNYLKTSGAIVCSIDWQWGARDPIGAFRFWRSLRAHEFAIVHQHFGARSIRRIISISSRARLVVHLHALISENDLRNRIPIAVQGADIAIAVSNAVARSLTHPAPIVVHSGVALSKLPAKREKRDGVVIGAACRLVPEKGVSRLIRAVVNLKGDFPQLRLEIAGDGPQRNELEIEAARLGLHDEIRFLGWRQDIRSVLQQWDIFATPTFLPDEGLPISVLEAMAEGLPVVATSISGLPETIEDGVTGYLVEPENAESLSGHLGLLVRDPIRRQAMGAAGRQRVEEQFSEERMVAAIAAIYDKLACYPER